MSGVLYGASNVLLSKQSLSHTRTVVRECYKDDGESLWKSLKFDPSTPKPLNRSSPNFAQVITSRTSPPVQTFDQIGPGFFSSHMREISLLWFPTLIFTQNTSKDAVSRKDVPSGGLETKIEWLDPIFAKNRHFGPVLAGLGLFVLDVINASLPPIPVYVVFPKVLFLVPYFSSCIPLLSVLLSLLYH